MVTECAADAGSLMADSDSVTLTNGKATISASVKDAPYIPSGYTNTTIYIKPNGLLSQDTLENVEVNPIEVLRDGPSYTIDTVEAVAQNYEGDTIVLIVGTDAYEKIDQWHRADELKEMVEFVVIDRPEFPGQHNTSVDAIAVSATDIRAHTSNAVPAAVAAYIKEHNLYASK